MKCPHCGYTESKVIDSRPLEDNGSIRRRRECLQCAARFTTYETIEVTPTMVVKKSGGREFFNKSKLLAGLIKACEKRPVDPREIADRIENEIENSLRTEITSREIGEMAMEELRKTDEVAYVRFVSVYREFTDAETFIQELKRLKK